MPEYHDEHFASSFSFPSAAEYSRGLVGSLGGLYEGGDWAVELMAPPLQASAALLRGCVEVTAGADLATLVVSGVAPTLAAPLREMVGALVSAALELVVESLSEDAAALVGQAAEVIPVVGQLAAGVVGLISAAFDADERATQACAEVKRTTLNRLCGERLALSRVYPTSSAGPTPADHFRQVAYAMKLGHRLPPVPASMYVLLCGGESEGLGFPTEAVYQGRARTGGVQPQDLRRKMWLLIKGIMAQVERPGLDVPPTGRDQGRSLMPLLQEIVRQQFLAGRLPDEFLYGLQDYLFSRPPRYAWSIACKPAGGGAGGTSMWGTCAGRINIAEAFKQGITDWDNDLYDTFWDADQRSWRITPAALFLRASFASGAIFMRQKTTSEIASRITKSMRYREPSKEPAQGLGPVGGLALGTGLLGLGYGAWTALSRWGPKLLA